MWRSARWSLVVSSVATLVKLTEDTWSSACQPGDGSSRFTIQCVASGPDEDAIAGRQLGVGVLGAHTCRADKAFK